MSVTGDIAGGFTNTFGEPLATPIEPAIPALGGEKPHGPQEFHDGTVRLGNQDIPANVANQMRQLGHSLGAYTPGQIQEAIDACKVDTNLIDDHHGINFSDTLTKDPHETHADMFDHDANTLHYRLRSGQVQAASRPPEEESQSWVQRTGGAPAAQPESFAQRLEEERSIAIPNYKMTAA